MVGRIISLFSVSVSVLAFAEKRATTPPSTPLEEDPLEQFREDRFLKNAKWKTLMNDLIEFEGEDSNAVPKKLKEARLQVKEETKEKDASQDQKKKGIPKIIEKPLPIEAENKKTDKEKEAEESKLEKKTEVCEEDSKNKKKALRRNRRKSSDGNKIEEVKGKEGNEKQLKEKRKKNLSNERENSEEGEKANNLTRKEKKMSRVKLIRFDFLSVGAPNRIVGLGPEVLLPIPVPAIRNKFSVFGNYSPAAFVDLDVSALGDDAKANLSTYEIGVNYYLFNKRGSGLYLSGSYSQFSLRTENTDISKLMNGFRGVVDLELNQSGFNWKIGLKAGNRLYIRLELGYNQFFSSAVAKLDGTVTDSGGNITLTLNDSELKVQSILENTLGMSLPPVLVNFGIGLSFFKDLKYKRKKLNTS
jgi:hypothetical protein